MNSDRPSDARLQSINDAFRRGRIGESAFILLPLLLVSGLAMVVSDMPMRTLPYAVALVLVGLAFSYWGRTAGKFVLPALLLGIVPLACSLSAQAIGHVCSPGGCVSLCVPLCSAGGLVAGALLARVATHQKRPLWTFASGAAVILLEGGLGCSCVGMAGAAGMAGSLIASGALVGLGQRLRTA